MAARAFMEQVRTVILQRRVRETQSRSEPAGVFQSLIAHSMERDSDTTGSCGEILSEEARHAFATRLAVRATCAGSAGHSVLPDPRCLVVY
jgi:hypothetical protein